MSDDWLSTTTFTPPKIGFWGWVRGLVRGLPILLALGFGLILMLLIRIVEAPLFSSKRPLTQWITPLVCRFVLWVLGIKIDAEGAIAPEAKISVSNHSTWLDIFVLNARQKLYFVSKAEVASWPGIGWLARATGTVFIRRERREARQHVDQIKERTNAGHHLHFFPEGTSTDGRRVLPFKPTLFAAFAEKDLEIQSITLRYHAPKGTDPRFYGWWGDMKFGPSMLQVLTTPKQGSVSLSYGSTVKTLNTDRKSIAQNLENEIKATFER